MFACESPARAKFTIDPEPALAMCGNAARETRNALRRLLFSSRFQSLEAEFDGQAYRA